MRRGIKRTVTLTWDLSDAAAVADIFETEGRRCNDKGWLRDADEINRQIAEHGQRAARGEG